MYDAFLESENRRSRPRSRSDGHLLRALNDTGTRGLEVGWLSLNGKSCSRRRPTKLISLLEEPSTWRIWLLSFNLFTN
uniref:Uncharacterized protein n=1 Tax=Physcomitrium patens TaxID=3218 RepID=A0A2K1LA44_PHYPA|nr:hypothetical protein PHYPA_001323 [Physcomitrium patens]